MPGGGSDISGPADQFRFVSQPMVGDGSVMGPVVTQSDSSTQAKAGVMLRATADPGSPEYSVVVSPGAGIKVQVRSAQGGTTTKLANPAGTVPAYLEITRAGSTFTASTSSGRGHLDGHPGLGGHPLGRRLACWPAWPSPPTTPVAQHGHHGLGLPGGGDVADHHHHHHDHDHHDFHDDVDHGAGAACPSPFTCADIGGPSPAGSQSFDPSHRHLDDRRRRVGHLQHRRPVPLHLGPCPATAR